MSLEHSASANSRWKRSRRWLFRESEREREWVSVPWAEFCAAHLIWWNGRWSILMYSWTDWRAPCAAPGPWNSPKVRRHTIQSIYKHSFFWTLLKLSRRLWIHCSHPSGKDPCLRPYTFFRVCPYMVNYYWITNSVFGLFSGQDIYISQ